MPLESEYSIDEPWVSFCMSTFKRPSFLRTQLSRLCNQTFSAFEIIVSDNDPEQSAKAIVEETEDSRIRYFANETNLGMVKSFNKSIERSNARYLVMLTDDDPIQENFLEDMYQLFLAFPDRSVYAGFNRTGKPTDNVEAISARDFLAEIINVHKTPSLLWSSCVLKKQDVLDIGKMPDYGSPHFADQALISMTGSQHGGIVKNRMYSRLASHESNFSKSNFYLYAIGIKSFRKTMEQHLANSSGKKRGLRAVDIHLSAWFFGCVFPLKKFFYLKRDPTKQEEIEQMVTEILAIPYMRRYRWKYYAKSAVFFFKKFGFAAPEPSLP